MPLRSKGARVPGLICIRARILEMNGLNIGNFENAEAAMKVAEEIIKQNMVDFGHDGKRLAHSNPLLVRCWYVHGGGKERWWQSKDTTKIIGTMEPKTKKGLEEIGAAAHMLTSGENADAPMAQVKDESVALEALKTKIGELRSQRFKTQTSKRKGPCARGDSIILDILKFGIRNFDLGFLKC